MNMTDLSKNTEQTNTVNETIAEEAFHWMLLLDSTLCSASDREKFVLWLKKSPTHISEFIFTITAWKNLDVIKHLDEHVVSSILQEHTLSGNIISIDNSTISKDGTSIASTVGGNNANTAPNNHKQRYLKKAAAVRSAVIGAVICAVISLSLFYLLLPNTQTYATSIGEQRSFTLTDGSVLHLNTQSKIAVQYSDTERLIKLLAGEVLFQVKQDKLRPFRVQTADMVVRAVGTLFNVYRSTRIHSEHSTIVTVLEGEVTVAAIADNVNVSPPRSNQQDSDNEQRNIDQHRELTLLSRDQLKVARSGHMTKQKISKEGVDAAIAWRQRNLVFRAAKLAEVVNEFNRYNRQKIILKSSRAAKRKISGVFAADKPATLIHFLEHDKSLKIIIDYDNFIITNAPSIRY